MQKEKEEKADGLREIYSEQDGQLPDLTRLETNSGSSFRRFLLWTLAVLFVLSLSAGAGFFIWTRGFFQSSDVLSANLEGPTQVESGEEVSYTIRFQNQGQNPLANLEMKLNLPLGFTLLSSLPEPDSSGLTWHLGSLTPGSDRAITIRGIFRAEVPKTQTLQAVFTYRPANVSSDFQTIKTLSVSLEQSVLKISVTGPAKALAGDELTYTIDLQNTGRALIKDIRVSAQIPPGFLISSSKPKQSAPDLAQWRLDSLEPGEQQSITVIGSYAANIQGEQVWQTEIFLLEEGNVVLKQALAQTATDVLGGTVVFRLIVDGGLESRTVNFGKNLLVSLDYANQGNETIEDLVFTLEIEPSDPGLSLPINWEKSNLETLAPESAGAPRIRTLNTLTWDSRAIPSLAALPPNSASVIDFILPLLESFDPSSFTDAFTLKLSARLSKVGSIQSPRTIESAPLSIVINSNFRGGGEVRYHSESGEVLGRGPLPPKVDQTTAFRVFWYVENSLHALENIRFSTSLPPDVAWTGETHAEIGTLEYNDVTRLATWTIDKLPVDIKEAAAYFDLAITPTSQDAGAFFKLTNATSLEAVDAKTRSRISGALDILTTEMPTDDFARGQGVVIE